MTEIIIYFFIAIILTIIFTSLLHIELKKGNRLCLIHPRNQLDKEVEQIYKLILKNPKLNKWLNKYFKLNLIKNQKRKLDMELEYIKTGQKNIGLKKSGISSHLKTIGEQIDNKK